MFFFEGLYTNYYSIKLALARLAKRISLIAYYSSIRSVLIDLYMGWDASTSNTLNLFFRVRAIHKPRRFHVYSFLSTTRVVV